MAAYTFTITQEEFDELRANVARDLNERYEFPDGTFEQEAFVRDAIKHYFDNLFEMVVENAREDMAERKYLSGKNFIEEIEKNLPRAKVAA